MKELIDLLQEMKEDRIDLHKASEKLENYIRLNTIIKGSGKFNVFNYCSKDDMRPPSLTGVFYNEGYQTASDAHVLVAVKKAYDEKLEGCIVNKKGEILDKEIHYPNWKCVVPNASCSDDGIDLNIKVLEEKIKQSKANQKIKKFKKDDCFIKFSGLYFPQYFFELFVKAAKELKTDKIYTHNDKMLFFRNDLGIALCMGWNDPKDRLTDTDIVDANLQ